MCCWISVCTMNSTSKTAKPPQSHLLYWHHPSSRDDSFEMRLWAQTPINLLRSLPPPNCSETYLFIYLFIWWGGAHCHTLRAFLHQIFGCKSNSTYPNFDLWPPPLVFCTSSHIWMHVRRMAGQNGNDDGHTTLQFTHTSQIRSPTVSHWWCCWMCLPACPNRNDLLEKWFCQAWN